MKNLNIENPFFEAMGRLGIRTNFRRIDKVAVWEFYVFQ